MRQTVSVTTTDSPRVIRLNSSPAMTHTLIQELDSSPAVQANPRPLTDPTPGESALQRILFATAALWITIAYAFFLSSLWAPGPSRPGIDENAYLVAGRNIVSHLS